MSTTTKRQAGQASSSKTTTRKRKRRSQPSAPSAAPVEIQHDQEPEEFEVECILGVRNVMEGVAQFHVKWKGYDDTANTWEPLENLQNCLEMTKAFLITTFASEAHSSFKNSENLPSSNSAPTPTTVAQDPPPAPASAPATLRTRPIRSATQTKVATAPSSASSSKKNQAPAPTIRTLQDLMRTTLSATAPPDPTLAARLKAFEDIFKGSAGPKITVENTIDNEALPPEFTYINSSVYGEGVQEPDAAFLSWCYCGPSGCKLETCDCLKEASRSDLAVAVVPFEKDGRVSQMAGQLLFECNSKCGCGPDCFTKASQRGRTVKLKIKRMPMKGWGVLLDQDEVVPERTFIARYVGEIVTNEEADRRGMEYDKNGMTYLFDLDYNVDVEAKYSVDALKMGNESHFFNHSCDPNLSVYALLGETADEDMQTLSFWSNRDIRRGDELTFDYNGLFRPSWSPSWSPLEVIGNNRQASAGSKGPKIPCHCGAKNCRKWVHL